MKLTKALRYTLIFVIIGAITTILVVYVQHNTLKSYDRNLPYLNLADDLTSRSSKAYLSFDKILSGDKTFSMQQHVLGVFAACHQILKGAYDGKRTELGDFSKIRDEDTKVRLKEAIIDIGNLINAAKERWEEKKDVTPDQSNSAGLMSSNATSEADKNFEMAYEDFQRTMDRLNKHITAHVEQDTKNLTGLSWISGILVFISFTLVCAFVYRSVNSSDKTVLENKLKLEEEIKRVGTLSQFIDAISAGDYNMMLESDGHNDNLTATLVNMRDNLKKNTEEDKRRNWTTSGLAQVGELLRASTINTEELYDKIIQFLVKYTKSNQGGLFILDDETEGDHHLELMACYAFERKKFLQKRVDIGNDLVGQCFLEGQRIVVRQVPEEYISITSGLGGSNPNALLLVPLKVDDKIYGVIELASFRQYEDYEIELVEKLAESIASTIASVKVNDTTRTLLERTQQQAEEMKSQEEEIRQNMEELEATQEEMKRKQVILERELSQSQLQTESLRSQEKKLAESQYMLQIIVDNIPRAIFWKDAELRFEGCNKIFASIAGVSSPAELIGKSDFDMSWREHAEAYRNDDLEVINSRKAKLDIEETNVGKEGEKSWVLTSKVPIIGENDSVLAILGMFEDITPRKVKDAEIAIKLEEREKILIELHELRQILENKKG